MATNGQTSREHTPMSSTPPLDKDLHWHGASGSRSPSPEEVDEHEMEDMRRRAIEMSESITSGTGKGSAREVELLDMLLRLTESRIPSRSQVLEQASTIANLFQQRQFLLDRSEEERGMWEADRNSWTRMIEAILAQANKVAHPNIYKEPGKQQNFLETENGVLRQKLLDAQVRLSALEAELAQLKPILLMKPYALAHSFPIGRKEETQAGPSTSTNDSSTGQQDKTPKASSKDEKKSLYYRRKEYTLISGTSGPKQKVRRAPISADARAEHMLLAARKIGRERASILSAAAYREDDPPPLNITSPTGKGKSKADDGNGHQVASSSNAVAGPSTPKTPQKHMRMPFGSPGMHYPPGQHFLLPSPPIPRMPGGPHPPPFAYIPGPIPGPAYALYSPAAYGYTLSAPTVSPGRKGSTGGQQQAPGKQPATPIVTSPKPPGTNAPQSSPVPQAGPSKTAKPAATRKRGGKKKEPAATATTPSSAGPSSSKSPMSSYTAFDMLHSAAQSVLSPAADLESPSRQRAPGSGPRHGSKRVMDVDALDGDLSPTPTKKRPRLLGDLVDDEHDDDERHGTSALDVLADQAMVFGSNSQSTARSTAGSAHSHSRSGSEHSFGEPEIDRDSHSNSSSTSNTLTAQPKSNPKYKLRPVSSSRPTSTNGNPSSGSPGPADRHSDAIASKPVPQNGVDNPRSPAEQHAMIASGESESDAEERDTSQGKTMKHPGRSRGSRGQHSRQHSHDEVRQRWLEKLGMSGKS